MDGVDHHLEQGQAFWRNPEAAADRARHAGEKFEPGDSSLGGAEGDVEVERAGPGADPFVLGAHLGKPAPKPHRHPGNAAVAHQQVGGDTDYRDRDIGRQLR